MRRKWSLLGCAMLLGGAAAGLWGADAAKEERSPGSEVGIESYKSARYNNKTGIAVLEQGVIAHEGTRIAADKIVYDSRKSAGTASGHVRFEGERATVTSASARADFRARQVVFEGEVVMVTERAREKEPPEKTTMTCNKLEYHYRERKGVATGPVRVEQADQWASGEAAIYDGEAESFSIMGSVMVKNDRGETLEGQKATLSLKDDTIDLEGPGRGRFLIEEEGKEKKAGS